MRQITLPEYTSGKFVNRESEINLVRERVKTLIKGPSPEMRTIAFVGERGTGKSWLLAHLCTEVEKFKEVGVFWLDLRDYDNQDIVLSIMDALKHFGEVLSVEDYGATPVEISRGLMESVREWLKKHFLVLFLDHVYESDWELLEGLEDYLLGPLAIESRSLIVLAGRGKEHIWKTPELRSEPIELLPFTPQDTASQIEKQVPNPKESPADVHRLGKGYPLNNVVLATMGFREGLDVLVEELLKPVPEDERSTLCEYLEALCVLRSFDEERIPAMFAAYYEDPSFLEWKYTDARPVREKIVGYGYAKWSDEHNGYVMDDAVQTAVDAALRFGKQRQPERRARLQGIASRRYEIWMREYPKARAWWEREAVYHYEEDVVSLLAIKPEDLVGRQKELKQVEDAIKDEENSYVIQISGPGGVGKTFFLRHILNTWKNTPDLLVANDLIDLYHTTHHTKDGLQKAILRVFSLEKLDDIYEQEHNKRRILVLDTVERLLLRDPVVDQLGLREERPAILQWLVEDFLPRCNNIVLFLAGRPEAQNLRGNLKVQGKRYWTIDLRGFSKKETLEYFDVLAETTEKRGDVPTAQWLHRLAKKQRSAIFQSLCDYDDQGNELGVRPILLSLVIDYLAISGRELHKLNWAQPKKSFKSHHMLRLELEQNLVHAVQGIGRPTDDIIQLLAYTPKGMDAELLARLYKTNGSGDKKDIKYAQLLLDGLSSLSFVKMYPRDNRVFLHDEMQSLLRRYVLDNPDKTEEDVKKKEHINRVIERYYKDKIDWIHKEIGAIYREATEAKLLSSGKFVAPQVRLREARAEEAYYRYRTDFMEGFYTYFSHWDQAILTQDWSMDEHLQFELLSTWEEEYKYADEARRNELRRIQERYIKPDAATRWLKRYLSKDKYGDALEVARKLRGKAAVLLEAGGDLNRRQLDSWEGLTHTYMGNYASAANLLNENLINELTSMEVSDDERPLRDAILARAYNNLGYLARVLDRPRRSANAYWKSLPYWRRLNMKIEQANTVNNLAFALGFQGKFDSARRCGKDALQMRRDLGPGIPVVLSLTTLAEIENYAGHYLEAQKYAEEALRLSQSLDFKRGEGLARLVLAALCRFRAEPDPAVSMMEREKLLEQSLTQSQIAHAIFTEESSEPEREIIALYEKGVTLREFCRPPISDEVKFTEAKSCLAQAVEKSKQKKLWALYLDTSLGLAWLHYYIPGKRKEAIALLDALERETSQDDELKHYLITTKNYPEVDDDIIIGVFSQFGRSHALRGVIALDSYEVSAKELPSTDLIDATNHFTLAFEYDALISESFRDVRRAVNMVHGRLKGFNELELLEIFNAVKETPGVILPKSKRVENILFWKLLEEHFGPYEVFQEFAQSGS